jgi:hypothetical protein
MILEDKPLISEVVLSQLISEQDWGKTHMKASKNRNSVFGGNITFVQFMQLWNCINEGMLRFWSVYLILLLMTIFYCLRPL